LVIKQENSAIETSIENDDFCNYLKLF